MPYDTLARFWQDLRQPNLPAPVIAYGRASFIAGVTAAKIIVERGGDLESQLRQFQEEKLN